MLIRRKLIERVSGVYCCSLAIDGDVVLIRVHKVCRNNFTCFREAEASSTVARFRACGDPERIAKETVDLLIKAIEEAIISG